MRVFRHILSQPFVFSTGLAALAHSTWSLGTLFAGREPEQFTPAWWAWLLPALLIAFSLDVGQIATSAEIRSGQRTRAKYATFATFAIATYYLQWLYISHHMPLLQLAPGVSAWSTGITMIVRDLAQWLIPVLLPLSTLLYTFSTEHDQQPAPVSPDMPQIGIAEPSNALIVLPSADPERIIVEKPSGERIEVECPDCDWAGSYGDARAARNALTAHRRKHPAMSTGVVVTD